jgi:hypothetical protein
MRALRDRLLISVCTRHGAEERIVEIVVRAG